MPYKKHVFQTPKADKRCQLCFACIRACAANAIYFKDNKIHISEERCISDGNCILACKAKVLNFASDVELVKKWLEQGEKVTAITNPFKLPFCIDFNTSTQFLYPLVSMTLVLVKSSLNPKIFEKFPGKKKALKSSQKTVISSYCNSTVLLIRKYFPDLIDYLVLAASPRCITASLVKKSFNPDKIVFIAPCLSFK
ncbi:hypothetical protein M1N51_00130 [Peptococcaceae bacterium]|nr:hypothetical protein [Peptococcaceae bacterium]